MSKEHEDDLAADDRRLLSMLRSELDPGPPTPAERNAFLRRLEERRAHRAPPWRPLAFAAAPALAAAAALWLALPSAWLGSGEPGAPASSLLAYAYYETDLLAPELEGELPLEYEAIAQALELP